MENQVDNQTTPTQVPLGGQPVPVAPIPVAPTPVVPPSTPVTPVPATPTQLPPIQNSQQPSVIGPSEAEVQLRSEAEQISVAWPQKPTPAEAALMSDRPPITVPDPYNPPVQPVAKEGITTIYTRLQEEATLGETRALHAHSAGNMKDADYGQVTSWLPSFILGLLVAVGIIALASPAIPFATNYTQYLFIPSLLLMVVGLLLTVVFRAVTVVANIAVLVFVVQLIIVGFVILHTFGVQLPTIPMLTDYATNFYI